MLRGSFNILVLLSAFTVSFGLHAEPVRILSGVDLLKEAGLQVRVSSSESGVGIAYVKEDDLYRITHLAHEKFNRCGGFERLEPVSDEVQHFIDPDLLVLHQLDALLERKEKKQNLLQFFQPEPPLRKEWIEKAVLSVDADEIGSHIKWLSDFQTRYHKSSTKNEHVHGLKERLEKMFDPEVLSDRIRIELIEHKTTPQLSLRAQVLGSDENQPRVILGGHLDSIISGLWPRPHARSPGADDNASGSAALIETFRQLIQLSQPTRTIDFFWYAGEEAGLLGSAEIAKEYKKENIDVFSALQLDMTGFPGSGEDTLVFIRDFTTDWLTEHLIELNALYIGAKVKDSKCGYACSDHASWFRQGFPTVFPFEATFRDSNPHIHTSKDVIENGLDFHHAALFAKLATAYALDFGFLEP